MVNYNKEGKITDVKLIDFGGGFCTSNTQVSANNTVMLMIFDAYLLTYFPDVHKRHKYSEEILDFQLSKFFGKVTSLT